MAIESETSQALPGMTWEQLQILLQDDAASPLQELMAGHLVDGLREHVRFLTLGGRLREIAIIVLAVTDPVQQEATMPSAP